MLSEKHQLSGSCPSQSASCSTSLLLPFASTPSSGSYTYQPVKTYLLLERITQELATVPSDAAARYSYCWSQAAELAEALLDDLEAILALRGYAQDIRLLLYPEGNFGKGKLSFELHFDPQDQFLVICSCWIGGEPRIQVQVLNEADSRPLQRVAKLFAGSDYDNSWVELKSLKQR